MTASVSASSLLTFSLRSFPPLQICKR